MTVDEHWEPGIGDPTVIGWVTVAGYLVAALGCVRASRREPLPDGARRTRPAAFWLVLAGLLIALGINKQLDLQTLVTIVGRRVLRAQGMYDRRRVYQLAFIGAVAAACAGLLGALLRFARRGPRPRRLALVGMVFIVGFVMVRAASFHHVDALLAARLGGIKWNGIFELGGIATVACAAFRVRPFGPGAHPPIRERD